MVGCRVIKLMWISTPCTGTLCGGGMRILRIALSAIPCANPDGLRLDVAPGNGSGGNPSGIYPPGKGKFFYDWENPEKRYLWRWICFQAPDLVLELQAGESVQWGINPGGPELGAWLAAKTVSGPQDLFGFLLDLDSLTVGYRARYTP
ncbi:MAG: hypothetical protein Ct9H300mP11_14570 [Chloroflexota bacterium]|nr:MAG: hypothetical protein Ct9H300mP11_14570 [Chloroflexota bacterium]